MSGTERRQRTIVVGLRLRPDEHNRLLTAATTRGISIPELLRERVHDLIKPDATRSRG